MADFSELFGAVACGRCGQISRGPCSPCAEANARLEASAARREEHADRLSAFVLSTPRLFQGWAKCAPSDFAAHVAETAPGILATDRNAVFGVPLDVPLVLLGGKAGAGKTTLAVARGRLHVEAGSRVFFVSALDLGVAARDARLGQPCDLLERAKRAEVVVLDDLGKDLKLGPVAAAAIIDLIFARHAHVRTTVVTTGLGAAEIRRGYEDDGLLRRLTEKGRAVVLRLGPKAEGVEAS